ncbi:putative polysaccharide biosynthesis protein [Priestia endophytica]|uniref:putative polysaccharide biosynthesis protein n=1 Tax=Priestia endophytica TaxID=135735 RepID=UPI000F534F8F|nr:polysaccharide biosynthesis protein [Priestia endophytica]RPJ99932.1 hypothetical protein FH5_03418 [Priestia endophytica]
MKRKNKIRSSMIWNGAIILTISGLITKVLSAVYRIPYHYLSGDIGFYIYQQIYPFYGISVFLSTFGFPVVISKLLTEQHSERERREVVRVSFVFLLLFSGFLALFQYTTADYIAGAMEDKGLTPLIQLVSLSYLFIPFMAVIRGYYQGENNMFPTALSQVMEQFVRVGCILLFVYLFIQTRQSIYDVGAAAILGSLIGSGAALIVLLSFVLRLRREKVGSMRLLGSLRIIRKLVSQGFWVCLSGMSLLFMQLIDSFTLYGELTSGGIDEITAKVLKGVYDRGLPLIQLGTVVGTAFSLSLVPVISTAFLQKDRRLLQYKASLALRVGTVVGFGAAGGLCLIIKPTNAMLYGDYRGSDVLAILSITVAFTTLAATSSAIIQGMNRVYIPALSVLIGIIVKWQLNELLVPSFGTKGAAFASVMCFAFITFGNVTYLRVIRVLPRLSFSSLYTVLKALLVMAVVLIVYQLLWPVIVRDEGNQHALVALTSVVLGGLVYMSTILKMGMFTLEELAMLPLGGKLAKLGRKK